MPILTTTAQRSIRVDDHMTQFCAHAAESLQETSIADHAATDAGADGEVDQIVVSFAGAVLPLCQPGHIRIVIQINWYTKTFSKFRSQRKIHPFGDIRRVEDGTRIGVQRTRRGDPDRIYIPGLPHGFDRLYESVEHA